MYIPHNQNGVTLIELMIAVAILAIVAGIAAPLYSDYTNSSKFVECRNEIAAIRLAEEEFFLTNNRYAAGVGVAAIAASTNGIYTPSGQALDVAATNCSYTVAAGICGSILNCYTITAVGTNALAGEGTITVNGP